jgi:hypothetical protein
MNQSLHPIMQMALAPFAPKAPTFKGACGNRNVSPMIVAKVYHHGTNDYRVLLTAEGMDDIEYGRHAQYGQAFAEAHWFSKLAAQDVAHEIARTSRACQ